MHLDVVKIIALCPLLVLPSAYFYDNLFSDFFYSALLNLLLITGGYQSYFLDDDAMTKSLELNIQIDEICDHFLEFGKLVKSKKGIKVKHFICKRKKKVKYFMTVAAFGCIINRFYYFLIVKSIMY
jgi:hypothetical protein